MMIPDDDYDEDGGAVAVAPIEPPTTSNTNALSTASSTNGGSLGGSGSTAIDIEPPANLMYGRPHPSDHGDASLVVAEIDAPLAISLALSTPAVAAAAVAGNATQGTGNQAAGNAGNADAVPGVSSISDDNKTTTTTAANQKRKKIAVGILAISGIAALSISLGAGFGSSSGNNEVSKSFTPPLEDETEVVLIDDDHQDSLSIGSIGSNRTMCLLEEDCRAAMSQKMLGIMSSFHPESTTNPFGTMTKGCFTKSSSNKVFWANGTLEEMSTVDLVGIQERVFCDDELLRTAANADFIIVPDDGSGGEGKEEEEDCEETRVSLKMSKTGKSGDKIMSAKSDTSISLMMSKTGKSGDKIGESVSVCDSNK